MSNDSRTRLTRKQIKDIVDKVNHPSKCLYEIAREVVRIVEDEHGVGIDKSVRYGFVMGD